jgi:hypothetical protein
MTGRATRLALGALTWIVAGASAELMHLGPAGAAEECLAGPNKQSPAGHHWFYRVDHSTKRHCWYLGDRGSHTARSTHSKRAALFARLRRENAQDHHADEAHAELAQKRVEDTLRTEDASLMSSTDRKRLVAARSTQDLPDIASSQDLQALIAARWPNSASVLLPPSGLTNVSLAGALATPDGGVVIPGDPDAATSPLAMDRMDRADAQSASRGEVRPGGRANSVYSLFWALCGTLVIVSLAGGATVYLTRAGAADAGWSPEPFNVARLTSWIDQAADISARFSRYGRRANVPRPAQPASRWAA